MVGAEQSLNGLGVCIFFTVNYDKEGGGPIRMKIEQANIEGFVSPQEQGYLQFVASCILLGTSFPQELYLPECCILSAFGQLEST